MAHHFHSHSAEHPARTEGRLIRWAPYYDFAVNITTLGQARRLRRLTVDQALIKPGDTVLDVGCGTGEVTLLAKVRAKNGQVYGIDPAPEMIAVARKKAARVRSQILAGLHPSAARQKTGKSVAAKKEGAFAAKQHEWRERIADVIADVIARDGFEAVTVRRAAPVATDHGSVCSSAPNPLRPDCAAHSRRYAPPSRSSASCATTATRTAR